MITPDDKDWTWVLQRPCPDCGFDASTIAGPDVAALIRADAAEWQALHDAGRIHPGRPNTETWSSLEYACHVRDVFERFQARMHLMLTEDDPMFDNWDQDASAIEDRYEEQDPEVVIPALVAGAGRAADLLDGVAPGDWGRPGRRSNGSTFTLDTISRYLIHDPVHHLWDIERSATA